uniref:Uncharacterized protein n=2 Tax=Oryza TaxID=4527 RepID=A0A0D3FGI3_9ORYZ
MKYGAFDMWGKAADRKVSLSALQNTNNQHSLSWSHYKLQKAKGLQVRQIIGYAARIREQ